MSELAQSTGFVSSASHTRPADTTAYTAEDVVGETGGVNLTFNGIGPMEGGKVLIDRVTLRIDVAAVPAGMTQFRLHLYNAAPTAIADNSAFTVISGDRDKYLGFVSIPTPIDLGATVFSGSEELNAPVRQQVVVPFGGILYGVLQTVGGFTPSSATVKTITLHSVFIGS